MARAINRRRRQESDPRVTTFAVATVKASSCVLCSIVLGAVAKFVNPGASIPSRSFAVAAAGRSIRPIGTTVPGVRSGSSLDLNRDITHFFGLLALISILVRIFH